MTTKKTPASTALAVRQRRLARVKPRKKAKKATANSPAGNQPLARIEPAAPANMIGALEEDLNIGTFGLVEVRYTKEEEAVLAEAVNAADIRVLPSGIVYLPHIVYTRWLNRAFGRGGWALRPLSKPALSNGQIVVPYHMMVHGKPVALCYGEQDYHANNKQQSYGDALEATHASALRRGCKHLGLALELWDREFNDHFLAEFAVEVPVEVRRRDGDDWKTKVEYQWRLRTSAPIRGEKTRGSRDDRDHDQRHESERRPAKNITPAATHSHANEPITDEQVRRLWTIARRRGRSDEELKTYFAGLGLASSKDIKRKDYDTVCTAIEHPGALPTAPAREPGMEG